MKIQNLEEYKFETSNFTQESTLHNLKVNILDWRCAPIDDPGETN